MGEVSSSALAPGTEDTWKELQSKRLQQISRELPQRVLEFNPDTPLAMDRDAFLRSLKNAPRRSGPGGCTYEHLKVLMDDQDTLELLFEAATSLAQAAVPASVAAALTTARLTALSKRDGGVRGIATGCSFRRLVARTLAKQFAEDFEQECPPFQYALSTRAGTDCVGHLLRAVTDASPSATVLSVDGIGAYDHVLRAAMLGRLERMPRASAILPFVRLSYAQPSTYSWFDEEGERKVVTQAEGGEQGDPLMPLLFSIAIQGALEQVARLLKPGEHLRAFLDDIYMVCEPERVRPLYNILGAALHREASVCTLAKPVWNRGGIVPAHVEEMGPDVWNCDGIKVLGTPLGTAHFVASLVEERIAEERRLWEAIPSVLDLQCAWQILVQSANPRSNHMIRTLPPSQSAEYARQHDEGMWATVQALLTEVPGSEHELRSAEQVATLPMRMEWSGDEVRRTPFT